jgi:hypothetical protein
VHCHTRHTSNSCVSSSVFLKKLLSTNTSTMSSIPIAINNALNLYSYLISDVGKEIALPGKSRIGWKKYSKMFCDSVILWALFNKEGDVDVQRDDMVANVLEMMESLDVKRSMVKVLNTGKVKENGFFSSRILTKHQKQFGDRYKPGYFSIKVSLHGHDLISLLPLLKPLLDDLADDFVYLHDIDIATDCRYVTSRPILQEYLEEKLGDEIEIVDDLSRVGNHCLSWITTTYKDQRIRCKMYNKLVQMLESAEVRMSLGSRMEDLVMETDKKLHKRLRKAKKCGLSRLEITFYGRKLRKFSYYEDIVENVKNQIQDCPTFRVPFEAYWKYMASNITSMIGVYVFGEKESAFAYCHWWNSITKKKYGSHRAKVGREEAMTALANYSFNDRPIYFLEVEMDGNKTKDITVTKYMRPVGCKEITLVAGKHKGLYPYKYHDRVWSFKDMGIVKTKHIKIRWPKKRLRKRSPPIVDIHQEAMDDEEMFLRIHDSAIHQATYKPGYSILEDDTQYTVIAIATDMFRGTEYIFATLSNGIRVRCGKSLETKIKAWLNEYPDGEAPYMPFTTTWKRKIRGFMDIPVV